MALSSRELYLVLRARDEASRVVQGFSRNIMQAGAAAQAASARAQATALRNQAAQLRAAGATQQQVAGLMAAAQAHDRNAQAILRSSAASQMQIQRLQQTSQLLTSVGAGLVAVGGASLYWLYGAAKAAEEYEKQVALTATQITGFKANLKELGDLGKRVAREIAVPFEQIQPALFYIFSSTNANMAQSEILIKAFSKAAVAGNTDIQTAAKATIAIMNAFNIPLEDVNRVLDVQFQLVRKGVGTYEEFANHLGQVIPSATRAGQSIETVAAMMAFLTRNGLSVAMSATSAARALEAMSHPKTVERLKKMGINAYDAAGNMKPLTTILGEVREKIMALPEPERVGALVELLKGAGGTIQARRFLEQILLRPGELEELMGYLKDMEGANGAFGAAYDTMSSTVAAQTQLLSNKWKVMKETIGAAVIPALLSVMNVLGKLVDWFNNLSPGMQETIAKFLVWGSVISVVVGAVLILVGIIAGLVAAFMAVAEFIAPVVLAIIAFAAQAAILVGWFVLVWQESEKFRSGLARLRDAFMELYNTAVSTFMPMAQQIWEVVGPKLRDAAKTFGDLLGIAFKTIGDVISNYLVPFLAALKTYWDANKGSIMAIVGAVAEAIKWFLIIAGIIVGVLILAIGAVIAIIVGAFIAAFMAAIYVANLVVGAIRFVIAIFQALWGAIKQIPGAVSDAFGSMMSTIRGIPGAITNALGNLGGLLVGAGRAVIQGFINGVKGMIGELASVFSSITNMIPDWKGPKPKDLKLLRPTGRYVMTGFAEGVMDSIPMLRNTFASLSGMLPGMTPDVNGRVDGLLAPLGPPVTQGVTKNFYQTVNVHTQEIDPASQAAKLGWELQGAM